MNARISIKKRIISVILTAVLVVSMLPLSVFAASGNQASVTVNETETEYATVQEAFDAAKKLTAPCTVKVLQNFKGSMVLGVTFTAEDNCNITLDVNGFDMYNRNTRDQASASMFTFEKGTTAHLTVVNTAENRDTYGGIFYYPNGTDISNSVFYMEGGTLTIEDVGGDGIKNKTSNYDKISGSILYLDGGTVTINGSKFGEDNNIVPLYVKSGNLTVNGGTFISQQGNALWIAEGFDGKVSLSGGKFTSTFTSSKTDEMGNFVQVYSIPSILREDGGKVDDFLAKGYVYQKTDDDEKNSESALYREISVVPEPGVKYIAADGTEQSCAEYTELTESTDVSLPLKGWYAVTGTVNIEDSIGVYTGGTLNLILCDGAELNLKNTLYMLGGSTLNIYGQSGCTGKLTVTVENSQSAIGLMSGISANNVTVNIYGGTVTAQALYGAQPIGINPKIMTSTVNVNIAAGMKCVKTDDQNTAYAYDNTDGTSITITKCTEHKWSYTNITNDTHDQTCDLCGTTETAAHSPARYRGTTNTHHVYCACGKDYATERHSFTFTPNDDGLTHKVTCAKCGEVTNETERHSFSNKIESEGRTWFACECGANHAATYNGKKYASLQIAVDAAAPVDGTVTLAPDALDENVVVTNGTVTIDLDGKRWIGNIDDELIGNIDIEKKYIPLTVNGGSVTLKNGELFQWWSGSSARTGIMINGGSVTVEGDVRVKGGLYGRDVPYPSITLNDGTLILKEGVVLLTGLTVPEGKVLADYLPEGMAFVKCGYDYENNTVTVSDPQEFVSDVYTANKSTESMVVVSHIHDFSENENACACGFTCAHDSGKNEREASYFEKAKCSVCHAEYGDYAKDTTAPTGKIKIKERTWWQSLLNAISFNLFYKETVKAEITATDDSYTQAGYDETKHAVKIEYLISNTAMSEEAVKASTFTEYSGAIDLSDEAQYVIYVKLTDHAGNIAFASTEGFEIDTTAPVIENMVDGGHYSFCNETKIKISDKNIKSITLDGREQTLNSDVVLILRAYRDEEQTLIVTDEAGNTTTVYIAGYTEHDFDEETLKCRRCGIDAVAKLTADDYTAYYATVNAAISDGLLYRRENIVVTLLRSVKYGDPNAAYINLWASSTSFTLDLNGYELGGGDFTISGGNTGTTTIISSKPGGALKMSVNLRSSDATLIMGEGVSETSLSNGFYQYSGTLKIYGGCYYWLYVYSDEKKTELYGGKFEEIKTTAEGVTCADLLAPEYRYEGVSYADAKAATTLENVTVVPCAHASLDENGCCTGCGFHLALAVEKDGVSKNFETVESAVSYAEKNDGCTVKLLQDITLGRENIGSWIDNDYINLATGTYTLDLAGKTLTIGDGAETLQALKVTDGCNLTVTDTVGGGKIKSSRWGGESFEVRSGSHLTIEGGDYTELSRILANGPDSLTIKGGKFNCVASREGSDSVSPFAYLADGCAFMLSSGEYANESNVNSQYISGWGTMYWIENVTVVPAPQTIDEQPTDLKFYLTSMAADKYVKFVVSTIEEWRGTQFRLTFEKKDGTVINETAVTAFEKQEITLSAVNFTVPDSGSYRVKLELKGHVLYSNTFNITVTECEHPGYDMSTGKCTQCGCDLAAAIVKGETTRGYVNFDDALTAAQTDENKGCVLWLLTDVTKKVSVSAGDFKFGINSHTIGGLNVAKTAKLNIFGGTVNGAVIVAKNANLIASVINFMGTVNDNGSMGSFINCVFGQTLNARGSNTNFNGCTVNGALNVSGTDVTLNASSATGKITVNNGGVLQFMGNGGKYGEAFVKSGGTMKVYTGNTFTGNVMAETGGTLLLSGGEFKNITVNGQLLIDCLAEGKALEDMNNGEIIDGRVGIAGDVKVVNHTHTCVWKTNTHEKLCGCGYVETVDTEAPIISGIEDGKTYYGGIEFSVKDANDFTVTVDGTKVQLTIGSYILEPDNEQHIITATDVAGNVSSVTVRVNELYKVKLSSGTGYTLKGEPLAGYGNDYTFTLEIADGYSKTDNFMVDVNGRPMQSDSGSYTVSNVTSDIIVTVFGVADITAPDAEITIGTNIFKSFLNKVSFGLFFKRTQTVTVTASDAGSGLAKAEYLLSETAFESKDAITGDWTELTLKNGKASFSIEPSRKAFVYVRVTDESGNITVINSEGVVVYTDAEAIVGTQTFTIGSDFDMAYNLNMNGNTVSEVYNAAEKLNAADYYVSWDGSFTLKNSYLSTLAAGEYTITLMFKPLGESYVDNNGNEAPSEVFLKLTVEKKTPVHDHKESDGKIYDGKPIGMPTFNTDSDGALTFEYKPSDADDTAYTTEAPKNVGKYIIRITTAETDTFKAASSTMEFEIGQKEVTISGTAVADKVYDGIANAEITSDGTVNGLVKGDKVTVVSGKAAFADKNVDTDKTVTFTGFALAGDDAANYTLKAQPTAVKADITAKEVTITDTAVKNSKVYDGDTAAEITEKGKLNGKVSGDDLSFTAGTAAYSDKNVGKNKTVEFTGFALAGKDAANYTLKAQPTAVKADITAKEVTVTDTAVKSSKVYDGKTTAEITEKGKLNGKVSGDDLDFTAGTAVYVDKNVGKNKTVEFTGFKLTGKDSANYTLKAQPTAVKADITAKEVTITDTAVKSTKVYDGDTTAEITEKGKLNGKVSGDDLSFTAGTAAYADKNVGKNKTVEFTGFKLTGKDSANYTLKAQPTAVKADITAKEVTITDTAVKDTKVYDGKTTAEITEKGKLNGKISGDDLSFTAGTAAYADKNVGKNKNVEFTGFKLTGQDLANYTLKAQPTAVKADITAKEVTITDTAVKDTKVYDGKTTAEITEKGKLNGKVSGDDLSFTAGTAAYSDKNVGKNKTVEFTGFKLTGKDSANYTLKAQPTAVKADITAKEVTITDTAIKDSKVYDGDTTAEITEKGKLNGKVSGDDLSFTAGTAAYSDKNVGKNKTVEFTGFKLTGKDSANYTLKAQPTKVTADITEKELTVANLKIKNKQYDGTNRAELDGTPVLSGAVAGDDLRLVNGTPSFDSVKVGKNISVSFTEFNVLGSDAENYSLTQPTGIKADITAYKADGKEYTVNSNEWLNEDFVISANSGWLLSFTDTADSVWTDRLTASGETENGSLKFFVKNIESGVISTEITEKYKIDKTAPTGEVTLNERSAFQTVLSKISFGLFFNSEVSVKFTAKDGGSGIKSVKYYKSEKVLTDSDVSAVTDWTEKSDIKIAAEDRARFIVYVRIEDKAGNVTYIGSDGAIFDTVAPELINDYLENGKTYYTTLNVNVKDDNLDEVTLNGEKVKGTVTLKGDTDTVYTVKATDKAGNETVCTVYMKPISALTEGIAGITADNVKSDNIDDVNKAIENIGSATISDSTQSTPEETEKLAAELARCNELKTRIEETAKKTEELTNGVNAYSPETVNSADKEDIEKLISGIDSLLSGDNLTVAERTRLEEFKNTAKALLDKLAEVKAETEKPEITEVRDITNENVKSDDKNDLVKAREELEKVLEDLEKNLTEDEKNELEKQLETVKDALTAIDNAEKAADEVGKLPSLDDVKLGDKDEVKRVKEILDGLTENEKTMLGNDAAEKVKALGEKIAALEKISFAPSIIEGAGQSWSSVSGKNALFRSNAEFDEFVKVLVDGKELDKSNYIAYAGSTVVELKAAYLKTLSAGTHTLSVVSRNGQADTTFTVEKERKNNSPKTGENNDVVMWIALLFISSGVMTGIGAAKKSKKKK